MICLHLLAVSLLFAIYHAAPYEGTSDTVSESATTTYADSSTSTTPEATTPTTTKFCPLPPCALGYGCGPKPGPDGCLMCVCRNCDNITCKDGQQCEMQEPEGCDSPPCAFEPICYAPATTVTTRGSTCPEVSCEDGCVSVIGKEGCFKCVCGPTCKDKKCEACQRCVMLKVRCLNEPCFLQPTCVPKEECPEPPSTCGSSCALKADENGCKICDCPQVET